VVCVYFDKITHDIHYNMSNELLNTLILGFLEETKCPIAKSARKALKTVPLPAGSPNLKAVVQHFMKTATNKQKKAFAKYTASVNGTPKQNGKANGKAESSEESESDSEEEAVVAKKPAPTKVPAKAPAKTTKESSSEESSSEDEAPPAKAPAKSPVVKKPVAEEESSDEDSDSDEEEAPAKKPTKPVTKSPAPKVVKKESSSEEDSSDEDEPAQKATQKKTVTKPTVKQTKKESSSEESSSEEETVTVKKTVPAKPAAKTKAAPKDESSSEEESSDEEEKVTVKKTIPVKQVSKVAQKKEESSSEDDSSSDEEAAPKKPAPAAAKKTVKQQAEESSEESSSDEEEEPPKKKAAVAKKESSDESSEEESEEEAAPVKTPQGVKRPRENDDAPQQPQAKKSAEGESNKLFVRGIRDSTEDQVKEYFSKYGEVFVKVPTNRETGESRGFAFVEYQTVEEAKKVLNEGFEHYMGDLTVNVSFSTPKPENNRKSGDFNNRSFNNNDNQSSEETNELYVGGVGGLEEDSLYKHFSQFGNLEKVRIPTDRETGEQKNFAFVTYSTVDDAKSALAGGQRAQIDGQSIYARMATPNNTSRLSTGGISQSYPKRNEPFRRVRAEEITVDPRFDNSFEAKKGASGDWGEKAHKALSVTRGKGFRHEKNKKKKGHYSGGSISMAVNSIKFD